jgi:ABC-type amino acid transport substrate-binding protein
MSSIKRYRAAFLAAGAALLVICNACTPGRSTTEPVSTSARPKPNVLRVGVSETAPPIIFIENDQPAGIEADLARQLGEALGKKVEFVSMHWLNLIPELRDGRIDIIMAGMSVTDQRRRRVAFAKPYLVVGQMALIRAADVPTLGTVGAIRVAHKRIGVEKGSTGATYAHTQLPRAREVFDLLTLDAAVNALIEGQIDVVIHDSPVIQWTASKRSSQELAVVPGRLTSESLAWAINSDNTDLLKAVNRVLAQWKKDGTLAATISRWMPAAN